MYDDTCIFERYRMPRFQIIELLGFIKDDLLTVTKRSHAIDPQVQLLVALRFYAKGGFLSEISDIHGVSRSSVCRIIKRVTDAIIIHLGHKISYPDDTQPVKEGFHSMAYFPNVVGAIDGTLIPIIAPPTDEHTYVCRKGFHALNIQAIVDSNCRFINIVARWPGSVHDSFILSNSNISTSFERQQIDGWLLGDSGYPLRPWLLTPIANPTTPGEERYNRLHKNTRSVVERAFGICKSRFRCLHKSAGHLMSSPQISCGVIHACFILHNICVDNRTPDIDEEVEDEDEVNYNGPINDGVATRRALVNNRFA